MFCLSFLAVIPPSSKAFSDLELTFTKLKAADESERSIKFLLTNELLHKFGLLDPSRSVVTCSAPLVPGPQTVVPQVPASTDEPPPSKSQEETTLKRCTGPFEDLGASDKTHLPSIDEEGDEPQR